MLPSDQARLQPSSRAAPSFLEVSRHPSWTPNRMPTMAFAFVAATTVIAIALISPPYQKFYGRQGSVRSIEALRNQTDRRLRVAKANAAELAALPEAERQRLAVALPEGTSQSQADLVVSLEALARDAQVLQIGSVTVTDDPSADNLPRAPSVGHLRLIHRRVGLTATVADYEGLKRLLTAIEHNLQILDTQSLTYDGQTGNVTLSLQAYALE